MTPAITSFLTTPIGRLRLMGFVEGTTLLVLLFVAVPLKRIFGLPDFVSVIGPLHGGTFIAYLTIASATVFGGGWRASEIGRVLVVSIIPFGTFLNDGLLRRKQVEQADV